VEESKMASPVGTVLSLVTKAWPLVLKYGPKAVAALTVVTKFVSDNPKVPEWFRKRIEDLPNRLSDVQKKRGDAAKIRGTLEIIREVALDAQRADASVDAGAYVARADRIERGVRLAETQERGDQKPLLAKLKSDTDSLLAAVLEDVSGDPKPAASSHEPERAPEPAEPPTE
jgi:hypothetical protein